MKRFYAVLLIMCLHFGSFCPIALAEGEVLEPELFADSAILYEINTGTVLYDKNMHKKQYPASITKIMTAIIALENGNLEDKIIFSNTAVFSIERNSTHLWMVPEEEISLEQGLYGMLLGSANEVSNGIAELIDGSIEEFGMHMTRKATQLGAVNTNFTNPHGLHNELHYTTAYDMALIAKAALVHPKFLDIITTRTYKIPPTNKNEERFLANQHQMTKNTKHLYEGCIGGKNGFTSEAGHTLVTYAKRDDLEFITVVLKDDRTHLYPDTIALMNYGYDHFKKEKIFHKNSFELQYPVIDGDKIIGTTQVYAKEDFETVIPRDADSTYIEEKISIPDKLYAPLQANAEIGYIEFIYKDNSLGRLALYSSQGFDVAEPVSSTNVQTGHPQKGLLSLLWVIIKCLLFFVGIIFFIGIVVRIWIRYFHKRGYYKNKKARLRFSKSIQKKRT